MLARLKPLFRGEACGWRGGGFSLLHADFTERQKRLGFSLSRLVIFGRVCLLDYEEAELEEEACLSTGMKGFACSRDFDSHASDLN